MDLPLEFGDHLQCDQTKQIEPSSSSSSSSNTVITDNNNQTDQLKLIPTAEEDPKTEDSNNNKKDSDDTQPNSSSIESQTGAYQPSSLDQEILDLKKTLGGVSASLGGWWGKVQKQSAEALTASNLSSQIATARKDLASLNLIQKAKKEVERLGESAKEGYAALSSEIDQGPEPGVTESRIVNVDGVELPTPSRTTSSTSTVTTEAEDSLNPKGKEKALNQDQAPESSSSSNPLLAFDSTGLSSFLQKLTKEGENLTASLQSKISHLPNPVQIANPARLTNSGKFDLSEAQKLAEGYLAKGEVYLQDVSKELKEFVQDAVRVIPPSEQDSQGESNNLNDGTTPNPLSLSVNEKRRMLDIKREVMVSKLRCDESQILSDPTEDDSSIIRNAFDDFISGVEQAGGLEGEAWKKRIEEELHLEGPDGSALQGLFEKLVPSTMTSQTFWTRYFFRIHRIDQEEAARRMVLSAAQEDNEGDFSWDMEDESEPQSPAVLVQPVNSKINRERLSGSETDDMRSATPKLSKLSQRTVGTGQTDEGLEDEWGNSPSSESGPTKPLPSGSVPAPSANKGSDSSKQVSNASQVSRRNSSEAETTDSFDVVSSQPSSDDRPKKLSQSTHHQYPPVAASKDEDDDDDWE